MAKTRYKREAVRRTLPRPRRLTAEELDALRLIADGADIHSYTLARTLRRIQQTHPELLSIGPLQMYQGDGTGITPYFGAILTAKGRKVIGG